MSLEAMMSSATITEVQAQPSTICGISEVSGALLAVDQELWFAAEGVQRVVERGGNDLADSQPAVLLSIWKICVVGTLFALQAIHVSMVVTAHWMSPNAMDWDDADADADFGLPGLSPGDR